MTIIHQSGVIASSTGVSTGGAWNPTNLARISTNGDAVYANCHDDEVAPGDATATANAGIWVYRTSGNIYIRCGCSTVGNTINDEDWFNTAGVSQGDPGPETGTGTNIFNIGTDAGVSVNIYIAAENTTTGSPLFFNDGALFTSDDKSTFFTPAENTKYGRWIQSVAQFTGSSGANLEEGNFDLQVTFRKAGETDYTITHKGHARGRAFVEP
jgi:hypothetical protein